MAHEKKPTAVDAAVEAAGGPLLTAVKCGVSLTSVYLWKQLGRVPQSRHAVLLQRAAREGGLGVAIEALAGLAGVAAPTAPGGPSRLKGRGRSSRCQPATIALSSRTAAATAQYRAA